MLVAVLIGAAVRLIADRGLPWLTITTVIMVVLTLFAMIIAVSIWAAVSE